MALSSYLPRRAVTGPADAFRPSLRSFYNSSRLLPTRFFSLDPTTLYSAHPTFFNRITIRNKLITGSAGLECLFGIVSAFDHL